MSDNAPKPLPRKKKNAGKSKENLELDCLQASIDETETAIIEELQNAYLNSTNEDELKRKRRLDKLKRSEALNKENDDEEIQLNTFDPSKKKFKNKKKTLEKGFENVAYIDHETEHNITMNKKKKESKFFDDKQTEYDKFEINDKDTNMEDILKKKNIRITKLRKEASTLLNSSEKRSCKGLKNFTELIIHRTDRLLPDYNLKHPLIRVHIVDEYTGQYLKSIKLDGASNVSKENIDYIKPLYSTYFDFKKNRSMLPIFEDKIILREYFDYITQPELKVIILFEIIDFIDPPNNKLINFSLFDETQFFKIAWAFLKLRSCNGGLNTEHRIRLQLFKPRHDVHCLKDQIQVYKWWITKQLVKYPSTLFVTIRPIDPKLCFYSKSEEEESKKLVMKDIFEFGINEKISIFEWTRLTGQNCKIPNNLILNLTTSRKGCHLLSFSNNGRILAGVCQIDSEYHILLFEIPSGQLIGSLLGHLKLIYELDWSKNDEMLLSASADGSARVWATKLMVQSKISIHPQYVYSAKFHPVNQNIFATGGYDKIVRVWIIVASDIKCQQLANLEYHCGYINSVVFSSNEQPLLYSGDNQGVICVWKIDVANSIYAFSKAINVDELKGVTINSLICHPNGRNILIHTCNNKISLLDLRTDSIIRKYLGALNIREFLRSVYTPCCTYIFSGSEDGLVYVWLSETGEQVGVYSQLGFQTTVTGVAYHPLDHIAAFSCLGESQPIKIFKYYQDNTNDTLNLKSSKIPSPFDANEKYAEKFRSMMASMSMADNIKISKMHEKLSEITTTSYYKQSTQKKERHESNNDFEFIITAKDEIKPIISFKDERKISKEILLKVLYAYKALRSDELDLQRGDQLKLLYKDNENWWLAENEDGRKGFIPSGYVRFITENDVYRRLKTVSFDDLPPQIPELKQRRSSHAIITKTGQLEIITNGIDTDSYENNK